MTFSVDKYLIKVEIDTELLNFYKNHAIFFDDKDLKNNGTQINVIFSEIGKDYDYYIISFKSDPIGYAGFMPAIHYETSTETLFIGAGTVIKTINIPQKKVVFEKNRGMGFWSWSRYKHFIIQQEEIDFGIFNLNGEQLWETFVSPPYLFEFVEDNVILKFDDIVEYRNLETGKKN